MCRTGYKEPWSEAFESFNCFYQFLVSRLQKDRVLASLALLMSPSPTNASRAPDAFTNRFYCTRVKKPTQSNNGLTMEMLESARIIIHHLCLSQELKIQNVTIGSNHDEYLKNRLVVERELSAFVSSWPTRKDTPYKPR